MSQHLTVEDVDKQVEELEQKHSAKLKEAEKADAKGFDPTTILTQICAVVTVAVPILKFAKSIFFFKKKWQDKIQQIIDIATLACSVEEPS